MKTKLTYLNEMGIDVWELAHPEKLTNFHFEPAIPDESVKLLFVCPAIPSDSQDVTLLENIAGTFQVKLDEIRYVSPQQLPQIQLGQVTWVWFCGCESNIDSDKNRNVLQSPLLNIMHQNTQLKRQLWQQIQSCLKYQ